MRKQAKPNCTNSTKLSGNGICRIVMLLALFIVHCTLFISPARAQDAFYIYQNDGHFDGFFYDEVQKISYSFLDTLGIEHDEVVSQEIATADSIYRIMLTAIDSVSFVQPENKLQPNVRNIREGRMMIYLGGKNLTDMVLYFVDGTPADILPRVGDVLVDFDTQEGFGGKVTEVSITNEFAAPMYVVRMAPLESLGDVFQTFVAVEEYDHDPSGKMIRRRVSGSPSLTKGDWSNPSMSPRRASDEFAFDLFNISVNGHWPIYVSPAGDFNFTVDAGINVAMRLKGCYRIPVIGAYYIGLTFNSDMSFSLGFTADGKLSTIIEKTADYIPRLPIPASAPIFELRNIPGLFARGDCHLKFTLGVASKPAKVWHKLEFNNSWFPLFTFGDIPQDKDSQKDNGKANGVASLELNGYVQAGLHAPLALGTNRWLSKIVDAEFGTHLYVGPKLSGSVNINFVDLVNNGPSAYNALKGSALKFQPLAIDFETKAKMQLWHDVQEFTFGDGGFTVGPDITAYLLPQFGDWALNDTVKSGDGHPYYGTYAGIHCNDEYTLLPYDVGVVLYMHDPEDWPDGKPKRIAENWHTRIYQPGEKWMKSELFYDHPKLRLDTISKTGICTLRPIFKLGEMTVEASPEYVIAAPPLFLKWENKEVQMDNYLDMTFDVPVFTNATAFSSEKVGGVIYLDPQVDFLPTDPFHGRVRLTNKYVNPDIFHEKRIVPNLSITCPMGSHQYSLGDGLTENDLPTLVYPPNATRDVQSFSVELYSSDGAFGTSFSYPTVSGSASTFTGTHSSSEDGITSSSNCTISLGPGQSWGEYIVSGTYTESREQRSPGGDLRYSRHVSASLSGTISIYGLDPQGKVNASGTATVVDNREGGRSGTYSINSGRVYINYDPLY